MMDYTLPAPGVHDEYDRALDVADRFLNVFCCGTWQEEEEEQEQEEPPEVQPAAAGQEIVTVIEIASGSAGGPRERRGRRGLADKQAAMEPEGEDSLLPTPATDVSLRTEDPAQPGGDAFTHVSTGQRCHEAQTRSGSKSFLSSASGAHRLARATRSLWHK